jgi:hypothetical protein
VDWNNDGKKDLITGEHDGYVRVYLNTNTDADPVFNGYFNVQVGGSDFAPEWYSVPWIVDYNNDSKKDLIIGYNLGYLYLLLNTGTDANPSFASYTLIQDGGSDLIAGDKASPIIVDWNRDGKKDIVAGYLSGYLKYWENQGTDANPVFDGYEYLMAGGAKLKAGNGYSRPFPVDVDEDGIMDLLVGCYDVSSYPNPGYVFFFNSFDPITCTPDTISESAGGTVIFDLDASDANAGRNYLLLGGVTGTDPGTPLPGGLATLPLNWDPFTDVVMLLLNSVLFQNFLGQLDASGQAQATLWAPPLPTGYVGLELYWAYCLNGPFDFASDAVIVTVVP